MYISRFRLRLRLSGSFVNTMKTRSHFQAFTSCTSSSAVNCHPTEHWAPSERLHFVFERENLIFTKHLISPIQLAMVPQFPRSTPVFVVFNYWETGFVWSGAKIGIWLANSKGNHTGSNQFNYPPIKVERPVIAVKRVTMRAIALVRALRVLLARNNACLQGVLCSNY